MYAEFLLSESKFFEPIDRYPGSPDWTLKVHALLGEEWRLQSSGYWVAATLVSPQHELPPQGFKLHVAADIRNCDEQLESAVKVLEAHGTAFKFIRDRRLLEATNSKNFSRTASGKFITAYPCSHDAFLELARELKGSLERFEGPHILTDNPVPGSRCVFYRYGGFAQMLTVSAAGQMVHAIKSPDGELVEDHREPYFQLPHWIRDPFETESPAVDAEQTSILLDGRYEVEQAFQFSNSGGVYKAVDVTSGASVVIKEARPHTAVRQVGAGYVGARAALASEYSKLTTLSHLGVTPRPLALFTEERHLFLAEEYVDAPDWLNFFSQDGVALIPFVRGCCPVAGFLEHFVPVVSNAIRALQLIHGEGIVLNDISTTNVLVDPETKRVWFIDLEAAVSADESGDWQKSYVTPGFIRQSRLGRVRPEQADDWYALGKCVLGAILPVQAISTTGSMTDHDVLSLLMRDTALPFAAKGVVEALWNSDPNEALRCLEFCTTKHGFEVGGFIERQMTERELGAFSADHDSAEQVVLRAANFIADHYRGSSAAAIWPCAPEGYQTNKWNLAYGAAGVSLFMEGAGHSLPDDFEQAILGGEPLRDISDAALYTGLSGIAYWLVARGNCDLGLESLERVGKGPNRHRVPSLSAGEAGIGVAALSIFSLTGYEPAMTLASDCAHYIMRSAEQADGSEIFWRSPDASGRVFLGYSTGVAGIAFFLAQFGIAAGNQAALDMARAALRFVSGQCKFNYRGQPYIGAHSSDSRRVSYWSSGAAGVGAVLLRVGKQLSDDQLLFIGCDLLDAAFSKYAVQVGQMDGMAGILDSMSDALLITGDSRFLHYRNQLEEALQLHAYSDEKGNLCFAGSDNLRLSCDFATGSAGVGLAALRLAKGGARRLFDFSLPSTLLF